MKIGKLLGLKKTLESLYKEKISPKLSYKLAKFVHQIEIEERFFNEKIRDIINNFGARDDDGNLIPLGNGVKIKEGFEIECNKAIAELEDVEVDVPNITFSLDELDELKLSVEDMIHLEEFIVE